MKKCEVLAERVSLVVGKGSIVEVDDVQYELARQFLKPIANKKETVAEEATETKVEKPTKKVKKETE